MALYSGRNVGIFKYSVYVIPSVIINAIRTLKFSLSSPYKYWMPAPKDEETLILSELFANSPYIYPLLLIYAVSESRGIGLNFDGRSVGFCCYASI